MLKFLLKSTFAFLLLFSTQPNESVAQDSFAIGSVEFSESDTAVATGVISEFVNSGVYVLESTDAFGNHQVGLMHIDDAGNFELYAHRSVVQGSLNVLDGELTDGITGQWTSNLRILVTPQQKLIYRSMKKVNNAFVASPLTGAPNSSQKGCRTPASSTSPDITPNAAGNVGPGITGTNGLSVHNKKILPRQGEVIGSVDISNLPAGLGLSPPDPNGHQHVYPTVVMTFSEFQTKLNSIPWN